MRIAALQYANGKVKECDGLNETLHSFFIDFQIYVTMLCIALYCAESVLKNS